ncbi:shikimate kinase [uncultured Polaribacter sp.]|uniref:shikimate kinase n=1 Tax=uncultured Polaribacter sp. TaxID=174711 RepID=UPI002618B8B9|nr:shikimate kinase [uncultured Polaribacter sp.]
MQIILLGYMASGKSSIGKKLAKNLSLNFLDLDDYISEQEKMTIPEIFKVKGEIYFRKIEHLYLKEILKKEEDFLLALGGGTPCYANNMNEINKTDAISVYLNGNTNTMIARAIKKKAKRPIIASLEDEKIPEFVAKHLFERRPFYEQAKITIKIDDKSKKEVALELTEMLG